MEKRNHKRVHYFQRVMVESNSICEETFCLDISLRGILLVLPEFANWTRGQKVKVYLYLADGQTLQMACSVVHLDEDVVGCVCDVMDASGLATLTQLLETNLEIPNHLDRPVNDMLG